MASVEHYRDSQRFDRNRPRPLLHVFPQVRSDEELAADAQALLGRTPYHVMRRVGCQCQDGVMMLTGRVPSYYHKQFAEEVIADLPGLRDVSNQLHVVTPPQWDLVPPSERSEERRRQRNS